MAKGRARTKSRTVKRGAKGRAKKRGIRSAALKGRRVQRAKAPRTKRRKKGVSGVLRSMADAVTEARALRTRLNEPDTFEDR